MGGTLATPWLLPESLGPKTPLEVWWEPWRGFCLLSSEISAPRNDRDQDSSCLCPVMWTLPLCQSSVLYIFVLSCCGTGSRGSQRVASFLLRVNGCFWIPICFRLALGGPGPLPSELWCFPKPHFHVCAETAVPSSPVWRSPIDRPALWRAVGNAGAGNREGLTLLSILICLLG